MGLLVPFLPMLYRCIPVFARFGSMIFGFVMITGFMMNSCSVVMFSGLVVPLGSIHVML